MPSLNRVLLIGRLTRDPETRYTTSGLAVASFSIAVDRRSKNQSGEKVTDFFRCKAWRNTAEFVQNYAAKGRLVAVEGRIELNKYTGQDGVEKKSCDIVCDTVELLDSSREAEDRASAPPQGQPPAAAPTSPPATAPAATAPAAPQAASRPAPPRPAAPAPSYPTADEYDDTDPFGD